MEIVSVVKSKKSTMSCNAIRYLNFSLRPLWDKLHNINGWVNWPDLISWVPSVPSSNTTQILLPSEHATRVVSSQKLIHPDELPALFSSIEYIKREELSTCRVHFDRSSDNITLISWLGGERRAILMNKKLINHNVSSNLTSPCAYLSKSNWTENRSTREGKVALVTPPEYTNSSSIGDDNSVRTSLIPYIG